MQITNFIAALCLSYAASAAPAPSPGEQPKVGPTGNPPCYNDNYLESCCTAPFSNGAAWGQNCKRYSANSNPQELCGGQRQCCLKSSNDPTAPDPNTFCIPIQTSWT
ncbi:hypothetical protein EJ03DRAFT_331340 [Teratosphaeria nubilosa]|uniref:Hydrophobin n=1 Tax=Teratosphaeria nubilosa TaxID=161662 RepID=A0A6G1KY83_9PEZI|nr:hypothetical protein EJ03DRAFT_331340 [Teratosphaeria nubilosa]